MTQQRGAILTAIYTSSSHLFIFIKIVKKNSNKTSKKKNNTQPTRQRGEEPSALQATGNKVYFLFSRRLSGRTLLSCSSNHFAILWLWGRRGLTLRSPPLITPTALTCRGLSPFSSPGLYAAAQLCPAPASHNDAAVAVAGASPPRRARIPLPGISEGLEDGDPSPGGGMITQLLYIFSYPLQNE